MAKAAYAFKNTGRGNSRLRKLNPQKVGQRIESLCQKADQNLKPEVVVEDARSPKSPLHAYFDWDDDVASENWRLAQARQLVDSVIYVPEKSTSGQYVRAFVSIKTNTTPGYLRLDVALKDVDLRARLLDRAKRDLEIWETKYNDLEELIVVHQAIKAVIKTKKGGSRGRKKPARGLRKAAKH